MKDDEFWRKKARRLPAEEALQVDPRSTATARWPSSTPATLSSCGSEAARSSAGRTSQRRRLSTSRRSRGCLPWQRRPLPACHRRLAPVAAARPSRPEGGQPHAARQGTRAVYQERQGVETEARDYTYACFFDFMSCFQKGPDGKRTDKEMALFGKALSNMMVWYAHPKTRPSSSTATERLPERLQIPGRHEAEYGGLRG